MVEAAFTYRRTGTRKFRKVHTEHLKVHTKHLKVHTEHLTLHTEHLKLHTEHLTVHTEHLKVHTEHLKLHTEHLKVHTVVSMGIFSVVPSTEPCTLRSTQPLKVSTRDFS